MERQSLRQPEVRILNILKEENIIIPFDFLDKLIENAQENYGGKIPTIKSIRAVLRICRFWKGYCLDQIEYSKLVCTKIYSMAKIHAAAITSNQKGENTYIGELCKLKEGIELPECTITTASYQGGNGIQRGFGALMTEL